MVYIRKKKIKGIEYAYLVQSIWNKKTESSKQETIKYLGKVSQIDPNDIPLQYRNESKVISFLSEHEPANQEKKQKASTDASLSLFDKLTDGNIESSLELYEEYRKLYGTTNFFDKVLRPVMYKIGDLWEKNKLEVATEHIASNTAHALVKIISERVTKSKDKRSLLICTPPGEQHNLSCNILESFFSCKGYRVYNISPSAPADSILEQIKQVKPDKVFVSITLKDNIASGQRLVKKIQENYKLPVYVGGLAVSGKNDIKFDAKVVNEKSLTEISKQLS